MSAAAAARVPAPSMFPGPFAPAAATTGRPPVSPQEPDSPQNLQARLFGTGPQDPLAMQRFQELFGIPPNAPNAQQKVLEKLTQMGIDVGQPPNIGHAREAIIQAIEKAQGITVAGDNLRELSLPDLLKRYAAMPREQQTAGQVRPGSIPPDAPERPAGNPTGGRTMPRRPSGDPRAAPARPTGRNTGVNRTPRRPAPEQRARVEPQRRAGEVAPTERPTPAALARRIETSWDAATPAERLQTATEIRRFLDKNPAVRDALAPRVRTAIDETVAGSH